MSDLTIINREPLHWHRHNGAYVAERGGSFYTQPHKIAEDIEELRSVYEDRWKEMWGQAHREGPMAGLPDDGWAAIGDGVTAASAGTAKVVLNIIAATNRRVVIYDASVGFIGASGTAKPVLVELATCTQATAGSGSSAVTPAATDASTAAAVQSTAAKGYTSDPTVLTPVRRWRVHPQAGMIYQLPLSREVRSNTAKALCLRSTFETAETTTNGDFGVEFCESL